MSIKVQFFLHNCRNKEASQGLTRLNRPHSGINSTDLYEFIMASILAYTAIFKHEDPVRIPNS